MNNVAIQSVNGISAGLVTLDYDMPLSMHVPASKVWASPPVEPLNQNFHASTLIPTAPQPMDTAFPCAPPPAVPAATCPIIDVNMTTTMPVNINVPGYTSVPQGGFSLNTAAGMEANKKITFGGGILTGTVGVSAAKPAYLQLGLLNM